MLVIDLDHFKNINDSFGHQAGDDLLKGVAGLLKQRARQSDVLARLGGDEFALLLPQTSPDRAEIVADEIVKTLNRRMAASAGQSLVITASVGVAISDGLTDTELLAYADLAMYEAKEAGRESLRRVPARQGGNASRPGWPRPRGSAMRWRKIASFSTVSQSWTSRPTTLHNYELLVRLPGEQWRRAAPAQRVPVRRRALRSDPGAWTPGSRAPRFG